MNIWKIGKSGEAHGDPRCGELDRRALAGLVAAALLWAIPSTCFGDLTLGDNYAIFELSGASGSLTMSGGSHVTNGGSVALGQSTALSMSNGATVSGSVYFDQNATNSITGGPARCERRDPVSEPFGRPTPAATSFSSTPPPTSTSTGSITNNAINLSGVGASGSFAGTAGL